jgi:hypothetical protein
MQGIHLRRPSPALVIAILALFIALGSASYAAVTLGRGAVKTRNIAPGAIKAAQIATGAVGKRAIATGAVGSDEVRNGSLRAADFRSGALPASTATVHSKRITLGAGQNAAVTAPCPAGQSATGGGWLWLITAGLVVQASFPSDASGKAVSDGSSATTWTVVVRNGSNQGSLPFSTYAVCAP